MVDKQNPVGLNMASPPRLPSLPSHHRPFRRRASSTPPLCASQDCRLSGVQACRLTCVQADRCAGYHDRLTCVRERRLSGRREPVIVLEIDSLLMSLQKRIAFLRFYIILFISFVSHDFVSL